MALTYRVTLKGPASQEPEDFLSTSLGIISPGEVVTQHGDTEHGLLYASPHLPKPLDLSLADPVGEADRRLFSHYLWNASLLLAELVEAGTLGLDDAESRGSGGPGEEAHAAPAAAFDVTGLSTIELGAGTAVPSLLAALLGAERVVITDYPAPVILDNLHNNVKQNIQPSFSPLGRVAAVAVEGHSWGDLASPLATGNKHAFDRVLVCDCLWMPWQHTDLHWSMAWFLKDAAESRAWVVAGFHTGRGHIREFFEAASLAAVGLAVENIWERDCDGNERPWLSDRGTEDVTTRSRWLVVAVLRRTGRSDESGSAR